ncbi:DgyrCDS6625 [Dimorphilus gyrociliatus]|uniref:dolichol kinase n=1 Tax=Dimorphilus gyrociliatus TaxID=2664684 RepID=A0A7I8VNQ9_9ANNE|nr:DgyrCDS6625 [Dimorphilus gyrociliatus]
MFDADEGESICIIDLLPTLESITVLIGIASTVITHTLLSSSAIGAVLVISVFTIILDLIPGFYDFEALGKVYRPGTTTCFYCGLLVPVAELLTRHSAGNNECFGRTVAFCGCVLIVLLVRNLTLAADTLQPDDGFTSKFSHSFFISIAFALLLSIISYFVWNIAIWIDPEFLVLAANCALIGFLIIESVRSLKIQPFGSWLREYLEIFIDEKDQGNIILTHIYLLVGFTCPLWLYGSSFEKIPPAVLSGVLSLGIGDTAAAVVGSKYGVRKWPGSNKSLEGTTAAILFQIIAIMILKLTGIMQQISVFRLFTAIVMTSFLEAFTAQIDNIVLPLYMYVLLI